MGLAEVAEARRAEGRLPGADEGSVDGDGEVEAGLADVGVVEEVVDAVLKGVDVEEPSAIGDLDAELMLFVAFAVEWGEGGVIGFGELDEWARGGEERWGLVEAAVEAAEDPVDVNLLD